ncbi:MAG TPA: hypothetical protein VEK12_02050 [Alphaproteobacteria bacterium]|nr:hypothetical protein [Alphaproteobacteria bacterium]
MSLRSASARAPALPPDSTAPGMGRIAAYAMAALFVVAAVASPAARASDSVRLFSELAKPALRPNEISWGEARATGPTSLVLSDVVVTPPRTAYGYAMAPIRIARVTIEDIDFDGLRRGDAPSRLSARLEGITVRGAPAVLPALGPGPYRANATIVYHVRAHAELRIDRLSLDLLGLASLQLSLDLGGLEASGGRLRDASLDTLTLRSGWLTYDDRSLLERAVSAEARQQHVKEGLVVAEWSTLLGAFALKEGGAAWPLLNALLAYLQDYRAPKGPLRLTFRAPPDAPDGLPLADVLRSGVVRALGAKASYAGAK